VVPHGEEFDAEGIFAVRTYVEGMFQREGIEDCEGCRQSEKEKQKPAEADLTGSYVETNEAGHTDDDGERAEGQGGYCFSGREIFQDGSGRGERPSHADAEDKQSSAGGCAHRY
jgi:hypothetical protein